MLISGAGLHPAGPIPSALARVMTTRARGRLKTGLQDIILPHILIILTAAILSAQPPGRGGPVPPGRGAESIRWEDWSAMRSAASSILGWKVGVRADQFPQATFAEAIAKADSLGVAFIEGFSSQKVNAEIPKYLDYHLAPGEVNAVKDRLNAFNIRMPVYHVPAIDVEPKLFEFAKAIGVETIAIDRPPDSWPAIEK